MNSVIRLSNRLMVLLTLQIAETKIYKDVGKFVCCAYDKCTSLKCENINKLRHSLFSKSCDNNIRKLPPSKDALNKHILRSAFVAGWIWGSILSFNQAIPSPVSWGWRRGEKSFVVDWCSSRYSKLESVLFTCLCKNDCTRRNCTIRNVKCLPFCKCKCTTEDLS